MSSCQSESVCVPLGTAPVLLARVTFNSGNLITEATVEEISYVVTRGTVEVGIDTLDVATVVHDTLQTDVARWKLDKTGYNFEFDVPHALLASEDIYEVVVTITPASGNPAILKWQVIVEN